MIFQSRTRHPCIKKGSGSGLTEKVFALCLIGLISTSQGAENEHGAEQNPALPDLEFLEFLGQFETDEGEWIDPGSLMAEEFTDLLDAAMIADPNLNTTDDDNDDQ